MNYYENTENPNTEVVLYSKSTKFENKEDSSSTILADSRVWNQLKLLKKITVAFGVLIIILMLFTFIGINHTFV